MISATTTEEITRLQQLHLFSEVENTSARQGAIIDTSQRYRYALWRVWNEELPRVTFIMLNPSTADAFQDDPTLRRCKRFAQSFGGGSVEVVNLFAYRSSRPSDLWRVDDPVGPENDKHILQAVSRSTLLIAAWGVEGARTDRCMDVINLIRSSTDILLHCLELTKEHYPRHPLYVRSDIQPLLYGEKITRTQ